MKMSLNKANKIRHILEAHAGEIYAGYHYLLNLTLNGYETTEALQEKIDEQIAKQIDTLARIDSTTQAIYTLRNLIQERNQKLGINEIISKIAELNELAKVYGNLAGRVTAFAGDIPTATVTKANENARSSATGVGSTFRSISTVDKTTYESIQVKLKNLKKEIRAQEEKRNELNHKNIIEIPEEIEKILTENDLI